jgi:arsenate reductase
MKNKILFICVHNSARSQMAEAFVNQLCGHEFEARSAGLQPGKLNPIVIEALQELGIDISGKPTQSVDDVIRSGQPFSHIVTVCSEAEAEGCPYFPGAAQRLHWPFPDPSKLTGSHDEKLAGVRKIRDEIRRQVEAFCDQQCALTA